MITKPKEHDVDRAGKRLLREALESLGWVVNDVQEDYAIDSNVQVFDRKSPTGAWFHIQLKSSSATEYSAAGNFISQELSVDHARHYAFELRSPVLLIHVDISGERVYWHAPQLDHDLAAALDRPEVKSVTVRIPTSHELPRTAAELLTDLQKIHLALANRVLTSASTRSFAESLSHLPDQQAHYDAFQEKSAVLKLMKVTQLYHQKRFDEARPRADAILVDPDSSIEVKFWAEITLKSIDFTGAVHSGKPQSELPKILLSHAKFLRKLTAMGPKHLKFFAMIEKHAAELAVLVHENYGVHLALQQHIQNQGNPMVVLGLYARRSVLTRRIVSKYNRCVRLARLAANYPDRWVLGRALGSIVNAIAPYMITLNNEKNFEAERGLAASALQICKLSAWISHETADVDGIIMAILAALTTVQTRDCDAYRWADKIARSISDEISRAEAMLAIERAARRWNGEQVEGDYHGDVAWQVIQNMASAMHIDLSNENDPLVRGLRIAAKDDSPQRILVNCEHLLVSLGATGPIAREIKLRFNLLTAGSKVVHCTLHDFHHEGREQDAAYAEFKKLHCDVCPDVKPRPQGWEYSGDVRSTIEAENYELVARLAGSKHGFRYTNQD